MRVLDFADGFSSASSPTVGSSFSVTGSRASPTNITAVGGITASANAYEIQFVQGSGGPVDISANPQVSAGTTVGQQIVLVGRDDTNTVLLENGTGLELNGDCLLEAASVICLMWDGTFWTEVYRNDMT